MVDLTVQSFSSASGLAMATSNPEIDKRVNAMVSAATSDNTRRAYQSAINHYLNWGGFLPAKSVDLCRYIAVYAPQQSARTISLRITAISAWHVTQRIPDPAADPSVRAVLSGVLRTYAKPKKKAKALVLEDLLLILKALDKDGSITSCRNSALLQIGFFGCLRRSELVSIRAEDLSWDREGVTILLPRSKTDQEGEGIRKAIPYGDGECCPVSTLKQWLQAACITEGHVFRKVYQNGKVSAKNPLDPGAVSTILKGCATLVGLPYVPELSGHSLRRGVATSARDAGANFSELKKLGGWKSDSVVFGYIEEADRYKHNAAGMLLRKNS